LGWPLISDPAAPSAPPSPAQLIKVDLGYVTRRYRRLPEHLHGMTGDIIASESAPGGKLRVAMNAITVLGGVVKPVARLTAPLRWFAALPKGGAAAMYEFEGRSGKHMLALSFSQVDPFRKSCLLMEELH